MTFSFDAIGTHWQIDIAAEVPEPRRDAVVQRIMRRIDAFDRAYSRFREDSLVTRMSREAGTYVLPDDAAPMMELYERCYRATDGAMTPLIGQVLSDAGYDATYSLIPRELHRPPAWDEAMEFRTPTMLVIKHAALLDVGAIGKGYLIDIVAGILRAEGFAAFCVDAGGDMLVRGSSPLRVGLEDPRDAAKVIGVVDLADRSLCGSAGNRRTWAEFHHIIDPRSLSSPRDIAAVWTTAETTMLADAMSTCLFFAPAEALQRQFRFEYLIMYPDASVKRSPGFPGEIFIA